MRTSSLKSTESWHLDRLSIEPVKHLIEAKGEDQSTASMTLNQASNRPVYRVSMCAVGLPQLKVSSQAIKTALRS